MIVTYQLVGASNDWLSYLSFISFLLILVLIYYVVSLNSDIQKLKKKLGLISENSAEHTHGMLSASAKVLLAVAIVLGIIVLLLASSLYYSGTSATGSTQSGDYGAAGVLAIFGLILLALPIFGLIRNRNRTIGTRVSRGMATPQSTPMSVPSESASKSVPTSNSTTVYCRYCGKENKNDAAFCKYCGKNIG